MGGNFPWIIGEKPFTTIEDYLRANTMFAYMGMVANFEQINPRKLDGFIRIPPRAYRWVVEQTVDSAELQRFLAMVGQHFQNMAPDARARLDAFAAQLPSEPPGGRSKLEAEQLKKFFRRKAAGKTRSRPKPKRFSLEKDWHVLHYALNHTAEADESPLGACILGGSPIPDRQQVMSFGPIRYLTSDKVQEIALALEKVSSETLLKNVDADVAKSNRIYLSDTLHDAEYRSYFPQLFTAFRSFYSETAKYNRAMLLWID